MKLLAFILSTLLGVPVVIGISHMTGDGKGGNPVGTGSVATVPQPNTVTWIPVADTTTVFHNFGVGLSSNQKTESETNAAGSNPNSYPITTALFRDFWSTIESTEGVRSFSGIKDFLYKARADNQFVNTRIFWDSDPGDQIGAPAWLSSYDSYSASHDDSSGVNMRWPYWGSATDRTKHNSTLAAEQTALGFSPAWKYEDQGWGAYEEVTYSGTHYASGTGTAPNPGVGNPMADPSNASIDALFDNYAASITTPFHIGFADSQHSCDYALTTKGFGIRQDCFGYRNTSGTSIPSASGRCHSGSDDTCCSGTGGGGGTQMCNLDPHCFASSPGTGITPSNTNPYATQPVLQEICSTFTTWNSSGYPYTSSFNWAVANHVSIINSKGNFNPAFNTALNTFLRQIGYRYIPTSISYPGTIAAGANLAVTSTWRNDGNAPDYLSSHAILYKLERTASSDTQTYNTAQAVTSWIPGATYTYSNNLAVPAWFDAGDYTLYVAIGDSTAIRPEVYLATSNAVTGNLWYATGTVTVTNAAPDPNPDVNACNFPTDGIYLSTAANFPGLQFNGTDETICGELKAPTGVGGADTHTIASKGNVGSTSQEWSLYNPASATSLACRFALGGTNYTATNAAGLVAGTKYHFCCTYDSNTKVISLAVDNGTAATTTGAGSVTANSTAITIGDDSAHDGKGWNDQLRRIRVWKRKLSASELTTQMTGVSLSEMTPAQRKGIYVDVECGGSDTGNWTDDWQGTVWTQSGVRTMTVW